MPARFFSFHDIRLELRLPVTLFALPMFELLVADELGVDVAGLARAYIFVCLCRVRVRNDREPIDSKCDITCRSSEMYTHNFSS